MDDGGMVYCCTGRQSKEASQKLAAGLWSFMDQTVGRIDMTKEELTELLGNGEVEITLK